MLEVLYCKKWTKYDRVGALIITPTRELAYQIFETLKKIGEYHDFSAGLIIGEIFALISELLLFISQSTYINSCKITNPTICSNF